MDPLARGDYPQSMRALVGNRLPRFSKEQSELLKGAFDFIGLNYYTSSYAGNLPPPNGLKNSYNTDARANVTSELCISGGLFYLLFCSSFTSPI
jgi:beta-glucosidase